MRHWLYIDGNHSYGYAGRKVADVLGAPSPLAPLPEGEGKRWRVEDLRPRFGEKAWTGPDWEGEGTAVLFNVAEWLPHIACQRVVIYTMFEGRGLPTPWVRMVNEHADLCVVPCQWCVEGFRASGVTVPMAVAPLGVDPGDYPLRGRGQARASTRGRPAPTGDRGAATEGRPYKRPYRFLWNGGHDLRKGWDLVYRAFWQVFRGSDEVELVLHFRGDTPQGHEFGDGNVRVVKGYLSHAEYLGLLHEADCYVFPSRSEGWGLPPREAACTGLPVIATNYSGMADDVGHWGLPVRACREQLVYWQGFGDARLNWSEPCHHDVADLMRWCFENRELAAERGLEAARWLRGHGTWEVTVQRLEEAMGC